MRKQPSIILQIRCGHFPLNKYLHRINKSETDRCQACANLLEDLLPIESINHYIFDCPAFDIAREELIEDIGFDNFHLAEMMRNTDHMKALIKYINRTRRFRD
jgi:hypothetical protein